MELITADIRNALPPSGWTEEHYDGNTGDIPIIVKFFTPDANWTWYAVEADQLDNGDVRFFGLVDGFEREWGDFMLSEIEAVRGPLGLPVERDLHFAGRKIADVDPEA